MSSLKAKVTKNIKPTKPSETIDENVLFEEKSNDEEASEYSDMENDLNNDDTNIVVDEVPEVIEDLEDDDLDIDDDIDDKPNNDEPDDDDDDDNPVESDDESEDETIPEIEKQSNRSNLLQNQRKINVVKLTKKEDFITPNILTRFEHAAMICNRAAHLEMGAPPFVDTSDQMDELGITIKEFKAGKIPFMTSRQVGNKVEWHSASEMQLNTHIQNVLKDI